MSKGETHMNEKISMTKSVFWNSWGNIFYLFCQWLLIIIVKRVTNFEISGYFSLAMIIANIAYSFASYGMRNFQVSDLKNNYSDATYIYSRIMTCILSFLFVVIFSFINSYSTNTILIILAYTFFKLSEALFDVYSGILQKKWRIDLIGKSLTIRGVLGTLAFTATLFLTKNLLFSIIAMSLTTYSVIFLYDITNIKKLTPLKLSTPNKKSIRHLLNICLPLAIYTILLAVIGAMPRYFLELFKGPEELGIYNLIATPTILIQTLAIQIFNPFITSFAEKYHQKDLNGFVFLLKKCLLAILGIGAISVLGGLILGDFGLMILYGKDILPYSYLLIPLIIATILTAASWFLSSVLTVVRGNYYLLLANIIGTVASLGLSLYFVSQYGMQGANIALVLSLSIIVLLLVVFLTKKLKKDFI